MERPAKIRIIPFLDKELQNQDPEVKEYIVPVNPESYSVNYKVVYDVTPPSGSHGLGEKFKYSLPEELKLDFIIDGTNTIYGYKFSDDKIKTVTEQIRHLKSVVYDMSGKMHQPRFLKIMGLGINQKGKGDVTFNAILTDLQITFTLFNLDGEPLRAKISATFLDYREANRKALENNKKSPDLTYIRKVVDGDTLPLLCYSVYDDPSFYLELSKVNGLTNFRRLTVGQELRFPPINKSSR